MDVTQRDLTVSFYDDYGELSIYAKQGDTQRSIEFQFVEDVIPDQTPLPSDFHIYIRGKYPNGSLIPIYEIEDDGQRHIITSESVIFHIPSEFLAIPGMVKCDLVLASGTPVLKPDGAGFTNEDEIQILSTHNFNIYVDALPTSGGVFNPIEGEDPVDFLTKLVLEAQTVLADLSDYEEEIRKSRSWEII